MKLPRALSVGFVSLGCAKNRVDSEVMAARLMSAGFVLAADPKTADLVVVNTCAFIRDAKEESIEAVLEACTWKRTKKCRAVVVAGCLTQRYAARLPDLLWEVDGFIGLDDIGRIGEILTRVARGKRVRPQITGPSRLLVNPPPHRLLFTDGPYAYLKIAEGCDHRCTFCAIPQIRGSYRSRSIRSIVTEAEGLLSRGVRELNLISQDVTWYGRDRGANELPRLLKALVAIGGRFWIRLLYGHPAHVTDELLEAMGSVRQVCHYLDLPIQHSHPRMLSAMGRSGGDDRLRRLFTRIRSVLPDIVLRTTCLVGFPGETRECFVNLLEFVREIRFDHLNVFVYSREENTRAARLTHPVALPTAERRRDVLMRAQQVIVREKARARLGQTLELLVEKPAERRPACWISRSYGQAPEVDGVTFLETSEKNIRPGRWVTARVKEAAGYDLRAVPLKSYS